MRKVWSNLLTSSSYTYNGVTEQHHCSCSTQKNNIRFNDAHFHFSTITTFTPFTITLSFLDWPALISYLGLFSQWSHTNTKLYIWHPRTATTRRKWLTDSKLNKKYRSKSKIIAIKSINILKYKLYRYFIWQIFLQVVIISVINAIAASVYVYMQFNRITESLIILGQFTWVLAHGNDRIIIFIIF